MGRVRLAGVLLRELSSTSGSRVGKEDGELRRLLLELGVFQPRLTGGDDTGIVSFTCWHLSLSGCSSAFIGNSCVGLTGGFMVGTSIYVS